MEELKHEIIIYDGVCVLCNFFIRWILKKDQNFNFKVTNLQSNFTKKNYIEVTKVDSVAVILKDGGILQKSKACLLYTSPSPRDRTRSRMPSSA